MTFNAREVILLVEELEQLKLALGQNDHKARSRALELARRLTSSLTEPSDRAMDMIFTPFISSAVQTAVKMELFDALAKRKGLHVTTKELAADCTAEELLVGRILRIVAGGGFVDEVAQDTWAANETTHVMASPAIAAGHRFVWDVQVEGTYKAPQFLQETGWRSPESANDGFIQYAKRTKLDVFEYMARVRPDRLKDFHMFMGNTMGSGNYWVDWYPVQEQILTDYDRSSPLLVDVGGGKGHDIKAFADKFGKSEQLILQDIAPALATIDPKDRDSRITYLPQNFFEPNQVRGARVYFMHHILHDWSEKYALRILQNLRDVMKPGYSKLLIHDLVLPDQNASLYLAAWDQVMMTFNSGIERSRSQWRDLLQKAGFRIEGIWHGDAGERADGIVQAVVDVAVGEGWNGEGVLSDSKNASVEVRCNEIALES